MKKENGKRLIGVKEVAEKIGMSEGWIYSQMKKGTLPFAWYPISCGGHHCDSAEVDAWLERIKIPAGHLPQ